MVGKKILRKKVEKNKINVMDFSIPDIGTLFLDTVFR